MDSIVVGRSLNCDLVINDPSASRRHFKLVSAGGTYLLTDLSSGNGTEVDGAPTRETELLHNACIKVGTTLFRFVLPGGPPAQDDPPKPVIKPRDEYVTPPSVHTQQKTPEPRRVDEKSSGRSYLGLFTVFSLCFLAAGTWYLGEYHMGWWELIPSSEKEAPRKSERASVKTTPSDTTDDSMQEPEGNESGPPGAQGQEEGERTGATLMARGIEHARQGNWDKALSDFEAARESKDMPPELEGYWIRAREESVFRQRLLKAESRMGVAEPKAALDLLRTIPASAEVYPEAQSLIASARMTYIRKELDAARKAILDRDKASAMASLDAILKEDPGYPDGVALKKELSRSLSRARTYVGTDISKEKPQSIRDKKEATREKGVHTVSSKKEPSKPVVKKEVTPPSNKLNATSMISAYKEGNFVGARAAMEKELEKALSGNDERKGKKMLQALKQFEQNYRKGKEARKAAQATRPLEKAWKADLILGGHYSHELNALLADRYAKRAAASYAKESFGAAAVFARKSLKYDAENINAKGVAQKCFQKAALMKEQADAAYNGGDKEKALQLYKMVLQIDSSQATARKRIDELTR